ncbi:hypothetical protein PsorP6_005539 [Peronosclerospora sorghi]|uniref:Uncharacterized protein n=1 Tax=Peronosclerospora sorghi TaxID=230839 RepID=A0ACC0W5F7_9STRA|nr:hypothetical protein PsorP6_005539 [Peronosclerospora sorghi]
MVIKCLRVKRDEATQAEVVSWQAYRSCYCEAQFPNEAGDLRVNNDPMGTDGRWFPIGSCPAL